VEEAGGSGSKQLRRAARGGGHGDGAGLAAARSPPPFFSSRFDLALGSVSTFLSFLGSLDPFLQEKLGGQTTVRPLCFSILRKLVFSVDGPIF
jgi:hypothetical protein